jgi:hypothetical protein
MFLENRFDFFFNQGLSHLQAFEVVIPDGFTDEGHGVVFLDPLDTGLPVLKMMQNSPDNRQLPRGDALVQVHDLSFNAIAAGALDQPRIDIETPQAPGFKDLFEEHGDFAITATQIVHGTAAELSGQFLFKHLDLSLNLVADYQIGPEKRVERILEKAID